jgi:hypothetical protein
MRVVVEALAGASPKFFISGANVKDARLNDVDKPEDVGESRGDLLKRFVGDDRGTLEIDAIEHFFVESIDGFPKDFGLFVNDPLHQEMEAEEFFLNATPFTNFGGDHQRHDASDADKAAEQQRSIATSGKRTEAGEGAPNSESAENEIGACGLKRAKTERGPDRKRQTKKSETVPLRIETRGRTEDKNAKKAEGGEEKEQFEEFAKRRAVARATEDEDEKRSDGDCSEGIANPPGEPDRTKILPIGETRAAENAHANGGAGGGGEKTGKTDEAKNVFGPIEGFGAVGELIDEVRANESLEGVAHSDASGDDDGGVDVMIDEKGASHDSRPNAIVEKEKSRDGDARGCPENGGMRIDDGQAETEPASSVIAKGEQGKCSEMREERRA